MRRVADFSRDTRANVTIMTALALPVLMMMVGGALDYARKLDARTKVQSAVDAALLATLSHKQRNANISKARLQAFFVNELKRRFAERLAGKGVELQSTSLTIARDGTAQANVTARINTTFMRLASINTLDMQVVSEAKSSQGRTEVVLVLDVTGSMYGRKLRELKRAAAKFVDTIYDQVAHQDASSFRVAIVPFSQYVNVGMQYRNASWIDVPPDGYRTKRRGRHRKLKRYIKWEGCVGSRNYPLNLTDGDYSRRVPGVMNYTRNTRYDEMHYDGYTWERNYCPSRPITPLMSVKLKRNELKREINQLAASGWTYIPAGLVWGWRVLSGQVPFSQGASDADVKRYNVRKVIVLMTDGENTRAPDRRSDRAYKDHGSANASYANTLTRKLCGNITATNPATGRPHAEIISITFDVRSSTVKRLLRECSTLGAYDVGTGQLERIFQNVAAQLVELHLSR